MRESLNILDWGRLGYGPALAQQRALHDRVVNRAEPPTLVLVEHDPVITVSQRGGAGDHVLADTQRLNRLGIAIEPTDRGGDVTYHGPGQLVAYPFLHLADLRFNVGRYIRFLEQVIIETVKQFGITAHRVERCTGVWVPLDSHAPTVDHETCPSNQGMAKLAAIGVRVRRNVTMHGLAINITTDLSHFDTIIPCGLTNRNVTSMHQRLGARCPCMAEVKAVLGKVLQQHYDAARQTTRS